MRRGKHSLFALDVLPLDPVFHAGIRWPGALGDACNPESISQTFHFQLTDTSATKIRLRDSRLLCSKDAAIPYLLAGMRVLVRLPDFAQARIIVKTRPRYFTGQFLDSTQRPSSL